MKTNIYDRFVYKKGFLFGDASLIDHSLPRGWNEFNIDGYKLQYSTENKFSVKIDKEKNIWVILVGSYCMDVFEKHMNFDLIATTLADKLTQGELHFLNHIDTLNGRFVCIYSINGCLHVLNDATASRSVYYCTTEPVISSHYNLINECISSVEDTFWPKYIEWVKDKKRDHRSWPWLMPGDRTPYENIKILPANHAVSLPNMQMTRFWPRTNSEERNVDGAMKFIAETIKETAETLAKYYKINQSMTAGNDSRITLAAVRTIKDDITIFTYHDSKYNENNYESRDRELNISIARKIAEKENIKLREITLDSINPIDKDLKQVLTLNHYHSHIPAFLAPAASFFTPNSIHLRSNLIEIIRGNEHAPLNEIDAKHNDIGSYFASLNSYNREHKYFPEVAKLFNEYYFRGDFERIYDYPISQLFFWEYRSSWLGAAVFVEQDLVCETFQLFNCRKLLQIGLEVPTYYRNRSILYDKVLEILWPDLLDYGLPNDKTPIFNCVNRSEIKNGQICFDSDQEILTGNLFDAGRSLKYSYEPYKQGCILGFANNKLKKGDYIALRFNHETIQDTNYFYLAGIKCSYQQGAHGGIVYEIIINGKVIYSLSTMECYFVNQIGYYFKANNDHINEVLIRLRAEKDFDHPCYNGVIDLRCLEMKRDYAREYKRAPVILDTLGRVKKISLPKITKLIKK